MDEANQVRRWPRAKSIGGTHISDFSQQPVAGVIEGDQVKLRSQVSRPGDTIPFLFSGRAAADRISGFIHLGEYRNADFTARRSQYAKSPISIAIPGGAPLAT